MGKKVMHNDNVELLINKEYVVVSLLSEGIGIKVIIENFYVTEDGSCSIGLNIEQIYDKANNEIIVGSDKVEWYSKIAQEVVYNAAWCGVLDGIDGVVNNAIAK